MVTSPLVELYIEAGRDLIRVLDEAGFDVSVAYWSLLPDSKNWRLVVATTELNELDLREAYSKLQPLVPDDSYISLSDISLVRTDNKVVRALSEYLWRGLRTVPTRVDGVPIADQFFEDSWVYRVS